MIRRFCYSYILLIAMTGVAFILAAVANRYKIS